jgi:prevent-host-death family protein
MASMGEVKSQFGAYLKASAKGPVIVTRSGKPVALIVGIEDDDEIESLLMACSPRLKAILEVSRKQIRAGDVLTHDEFWAEVEATKPSPRRQRKRKSVTR